MVLFFARSTQRTNLLFPLKRPKSEKSVVYPVYVYSLEVVRTYQQQTATMGRKGKRNFFSIAFIMHWLEVLAVFTSDDGCLRVLSVVKRSCIIF